MVLAFNSTGDFAKAVYGDSSAQHAGTNGGIAASKPSAAMTGGRRSQIQRQSQRQQRQSQRQRAGQSQRQQRQSQRRRQRQSQRQRRQSQRQRGGK